MPRSSIGLLWALGLGACGGAGTPETGAVEPAPPVAPAPASADADAGCVTLRDQELACLRRCESLERALATCADSSARGRIDVAWTWDGTRTEVSLVLDGEHLETPAACVREHFARFVPCVSHEPSSGEVPLRFGS